MKNKFLISLASPKIELANPMKNAEIFAALAKKAEEHGASLIAFPELSLTGATCGNLFRQELLTDEANAALLKYMEDTKELKIASVIGFPLTFSDGSENGTFAFTKKKIYNAAALVKEGVILGVAASNKETEIFSSAAFEKLALELCGQTVTVSPNEIYRLFSECENGVSVVIGSSCEDFSALGAALVINITAMEEYIGLSEKLIFDAERLSAASSIPVALVNAGEGESGTDGIYSGFRFVCEGASVTACSDLFSEDILYAQIPMDTVFEKKALDAPKCDPVLKFPFIPQECEKKNRALDLSATLQARALGNRMLRSYTKKLVIGVSGGLDSTLAVLAAADALDFIGLPRENLIAITMPCFGTTERTKSNALALAEALGCSVRTIDIKESIKLHFKDIGHDENDYNVVYENAQARERTQILMDIANAEGGLVVGTGDLSELALGFATYNGDHMSMYAVNASIPKTLMREMIRRRADIMAAQGRKETADVLLDVINTPVSPELLPAGGERENKQHTEKIVGPYELHDFFLYYTVKYGASPSRVLALADSVFTEYSRDEIKTYLEIFIRRFYSQQFKRSCLPDGPRVTEISLSPRGAWRMPSDVCSAIWRKNIN